MKPEAQPNPAPWMLAAAREYYDEIETPFGAEGSNDADVRQLAEIFARHEPNTLAELESGALHALADTEQYCGQQQFMSDFQNADQMREALNEAFARAEEVEILLSHRHREFGTDRQVAYAKFATDIEATGALELLAEISKPCGIFTDEQIRATRDALVALVAKLKGGAP